ncbi:MAG: MIP/aquaporin family protein [Saprospiraceae bacterium]|jgi:glycerol uptake facilitator protein
MSALIAEFLGTAILILLGGGVVANVSLKNTIGFGNPSWMIISTAWGLAVFTAVFITGQFSGAHLNPAVTVGLALVGKFSLQLLPGYIVAQLFGAMAGSWLVYLFYIDHYRATSDEGAVKGTFCTGPAIRNYKNNFFSEALGTFILVFGVFYIAGPNIEIEGMEISAYGIGALDALPVGLLVWVIGLSLGGTTGYAINPARDLGPRIVFALIPRKTKANPDWQYAWIPVLGPVTGAIFAALVYRVLM